MPAGGWSSTGQLPGRDGRRISGPHPEQRCRLVAHPGLPWEGVVHAQDIRQPLGLPRTAAVEALTPVAEFFARRNFAVPSRSNAAGLRLRADDGPFASGAGPLVSGSTLALVMSMAGRARYLGQLKGPGVPILRARLTGGDA